MFRSPENIQGFDDDLGIKPARLTQAVVEAAPKTQTDPRSSRTALPIVAPGFWKGAVDSLKDGVNRGKFEPMPPGREGIIHDALTALQQAADAGEDVTTLPAYTTWLGR